jgi:hypothetical protein
VATRATMVVEVFIAEPNMFTFVNVHLPYVLCNRF